MLSVEPTTQITIRVSRETMASIEELVKAYSKVPGFRANRQTVVADLITRGIRTIPKRKAQPTANAPSAGESNPGVARPSGEEAP